tara:strand:- start:167503 stop:167844 length:342 start_codon:yes stop_codon:yes gene_type:complete
MLNRDLLIVRVKQPFVDWINEADPSPGNTPITLESANEDSAVFLIHDFACEEFESWLESCFQPLFDNILEEWYTDPALWPENRTLELFKAWCDLEVHGMVLDYVNEPLIDDGY